LTWTGRPAEVPTCFYLKIGDEEIIENIWRTENVREMG